MGTWKYKAPLEAQEQAWLFKWADTMMARYPELALMYHIPNGGSRDVREAANLKRQGVKKGVPDIFLPVPRSDYHGLYIEMKRRVGGTLSDEQKRYIMLLRNQGYKVEVCKGFQMAADVLEEYLQRK